VLALAAVEDFGDTTREKAAEAEVVLESRTVVTNELVPAEVGVPVIAPVNEFNVSPAGNCPPVELHV
jgi:hypothetical protein